ncbi:MAG: hypothetical protein GC193_01255 [Cryomorphaceae bacterium]|nr:hypothetical protein [Cryomorphaceae bacterium]
MKYLSLLLIAVVFFGCKKEENNAPCSGDVNIEVRATWYGSPLVVGEKYSNSLGFPMRIEQFKTYLTGIKAVRADGSTVKISDVELLNFANTNNLSLTLPVGEYTGLRFAVGVPAEINIGSDPASYPSSSPLSISGAFGMFWTWNSGYIFVKFEGKTAFDETAVVLNQPFAFHIGTDNFYSEHDFALNFTVGESPVNLDIVFEADKFLVGENDTIDLEVDYITHSTDNMPLAERFMNLYNDAITVSK